MEEVSLTAQSKEQLSAHSRNSLVSAGTQAVTHPLHAVVTPISSQGFPAHCATMPTGPSGWCPSSLSSVQCGDTVLSLVNCQLCRRRMDIPRVNETTLLPCLPHWWWWWCVEDRGAVNIKRILGMQWLEPREFKRRPGGKVCYSRLLWDSNEIIWTWGSFCNLHSYSQKLVIFIHLIWQVRKLKRRKVKWPPKIKRYHGSVGGRENSDFRQLGVDTQLCHLLAMWPWAGFWAIVPYLYSGDNDTPTSEVLVSPEWGDAHKELSTVPGTYIAHTW